MNRNILRILFFTISILLISFPAFAESESSHIENPLFGPTSTYRIVKDNDIKSSLDQQEENDRNAQKKNPQYQKSLHQQNAATRQITSSQIEERNPENLQDLLTSDGLFVMTTGGTGSMSNLSYKGYAGFCIKVYIDGILANNSTTGEFDWNSIDINSIETIEVEDVPSLNETEFAGCIIRITTKNGGDKISADVSTASYKKSLCDSWFAHVQYAKEFEKFHFNVGCNVISTGNEFERPDNLGTELYNFSRQGNFNFAWNVKLSDRLKLYGSDMFAYNKLKANQNSDLNTGIEEDVATRNNINLSYSTIADNQTEKNLSQNIFSKIKSDTSLFYNFSNVKYVNNYLTNNIDNTTFNKISLTENLSWFCDFTAGCDLEFQPGRSDCSRVVEKIGAGKKFEIDFKNRAGITSDDGKENNSGIKNNFYSKLTIEPQVIALFWQTSKSGAAILPRLTLSYQGITLAAYREFILPTFNHLYWPDTSYACGNPDLKPEDGWSGFLGFRRNDFPLWAQYKISYYGNKICWGYDGARSVPVNNGDAFYNVVTLGTDISMFNDILRFTADATWTSAKLAGTDKQIMWVPEWQTHAGISVNVSRVLFKADYSFTASRFTDNENTSSYPAIHLLNASITFHITDNFKTYIKGDNLLDCRVPFHDNYYLASRKWTIGLKFER
ncbi:MAG: TonB-dependent receptor [Treponema sp.]|nr:TonB-dependent receptor [Candidatus Treponema scatequi]